MSYLFKPSKENLYINIDHIESVESTAKGEYRVKMTSGDLFYLQPDDFERLDDAVLTHATTRKIKLSGSFYHLFEKFLNKL